MADQSVVDLIEDWQTGFFVVLGSITVGIIVGAVGGRIAGPVGFAVGLLAGAAFGFLAYSYLRYGR